MRAGFKEWFAFLLCIPLVGISVPIVRSEPQGGKPFALVELFTSEGCSSCPPADELLSEIAAQARTTKRPIVALAFHVDYWDRLGWKDPFSDSTYTQRQYAYAAVLHSSSV